MISVSKDQLGTIEYLLAQSAQGNHVLFELNLVREVFTTSCLPISEEEAYEIEQHIEKLISLNGVYEQKAYVDRLSKDILFRVVKTYFNIVENNLFENQKVIQ